MRRTGVPFDLIAFACLAATAWAAPDGPVTARTTFIVSGATVVAVWQLHRWFSRWSNRLGEGRPSWAGWVWRTSLFGVAASAAVASWWVSSILQPSSPHAYGLLLAAWACGAVAVWTLAPWTSTPDRTALSSLTSRPADHHREDHPVPEQCADSCGHEVSRHLVSGRDRA